MIIRIIAAALTLLFSVEAHAAIIPKSCGGDNRVRCVDYDELEVVVIAATTGYQTSIFFSKDEKIIDLGGGDTDAWDIGVLEQQYGFFIKPKTSLPATNITIVTDKRHYHFDFKSSASAKAEDRLYAVKFRYPEKVTEIKKEEVKADLIQKALTYAHVEKPKNEDYWVEGAESITPLAVWDDGETTYFRFSPRTKVPSIYQVMDDESEHLLNRHSPEPNTISVPLVGKKFRLRRDDFVACIYNEAYNKYGVETPSMTISPIVNRVINDAALNSGTQINTNAIPSVDSLMKVPMAMPMAPANLIDSGQRPSAAMPRR